MPDSIEVRFKWFGLSSDLKFKRFGCQWICFKRFSCQSIWDSNDVVFNWFEIQVIRLSIDLRFKWFGWQRFEIQMSHDCQLIWDSVIWMSNDLRFKWFGCQLMCDSNDFVKRSFSARLPSKMNLWRSKTKQFGETSFKNHALTLKTKHFCQTSFKNHSLTLKNEAYFCETSFKIEALKLKNEAFLRDFLQNWSFEAPKRSFSARLPSKMKLWSSKTKHFCETSFKNEALKLKNEAFLRDFLQKWHVDQTLDLRIAIRFSDFQLDASKVLRLPRKSWAEAYEVLQLPREMITAK